MNRPPQVAHITKMKSGVSFWTHGVGYMHEPWEEERVGDLYLIPGFEDVPVVVTKPRGSFAKHNKQDFQVHEPNTGLLVFEFTPIKNVDCTAMEALKGAEQLFKAIGKARLIEELNKVLEEMY
jgi:hypothetical protein